MNDKLTPPHVKKWLKENGKNREWLAHELGISTGTLHNWLAAGLSDAAARNISRIFEVELLRQAPARADSSLSLSMAEWLEITAAAKIAGFGDDVESFIFETLKTAARNLKK